MTLAPDLPLRSGAIFAAGSLPTTTPSNSRSNALLGSMILGRGAPPSPYDRVRPGPVPSLPTPRERLRTRLLLPRPLLPARDWVGGRVFGLLSPLVGGAR